MLAACSSLAPAVPEDPSRELAGVPFYPQTIHQCGPAALATVLAWSGVDTSPDLLAPQVYIPGRKGSLSLELVAAARRAGRLPYEIPPAAPALAAEIAAGNPVLVLQDLGIAGIHVWHYAVVVGVDDQAGVYVLRSGKTRRSVERRERFLDSWLGAGGWAIVILPPDRLPASLSAEAVVRTVENSRPFLPPGTAARVYGLALQRWPGNATLLFAAGNEALAAGELALAEERYRRLLTGAPDDLAARNNLAGVLLERGCPAAAREQAELALEALNRDAGAGSTWRAAVEDTLAEAARDGANGAGC